MRIAAIVILGCVTACCLCGCQGGPKGGGVLLGVDFPQDQPARYELVSHRKTVIVLDPNNPTSSSTTQLLDESLEITAAYKAIAIEPNGTTIVEASYEKSKVDRTTNIGTSLASDDAMNKLAGKKVRFGVTPTGVITGTGELYKLMDELMNVAFRGKGGGVKDPEMIQDFLALQYFMWDTISSIKDPLKGAAVNDTWESVILTPLSWPAKQPRDVVYKLEKIEDGPGGQVALITSSYKLGQNAPNDWPMPYKGSFQLRSTFGFLRNYDIKTIDGNDVEHYSVDGGYIVDHEQNYKLAATALFPFPLGPDGKLPKPEITVEQKLSVKRIDSQNK